MRAKKSCHPSQNCPFIPDAGLKDPESEATLVEILQIAAPISQNYHQNFSAVHPNPRLANFQ